jgi:hypothetical protein
VKDIGRRLRKLEQKLNPTNELKEPDVFIIWTESHKDDEKTLPEDVKEWLTYQEQLERCQTGLIFLIAIDEVRIRQGLPPIMGFNLD